MLRAKVIISEFSSSERPYCMKKNLLLILIWLHFPWIIPGSYCQNIDSGSKLINKHIITGADQLGDFLPKLKGKKIALVANQSSVIGQTHLVDTFLTYGLDIKKIFCPERYET
jgi:uncharacterized protein YbbC (DUF1343 family)